MFTFMSAFIRPISVCVLAASILVTGCASTNDVMAAKESGKEGITHDYAVSQDQAWEIAKTVFRWEGTDAIEEHRPEGYMLTSTGVGFLTAGGVMGAWISSDANGNSIVTIVTKRRVQTNVITPLTEATFHQRFAQAVGIVKAGQPLPRVAPPASS